MYKILTINNYQFVIKSIAKIVILKLVDENSILEYLIYM